MHWPHSAASASLMTAAGSLPSIPASPAGASSYWTMFHGHPGSHLQGSSTDPYGHSAYHKGKLSTTLWEDEGTLCYQVDARGYSVARRQDNNMINGTKLLNVVGMSRGKRDGILKNEKGRVVVKVGAMHLKGVWITFTRAQQLATQYKIYEALYPLFVEDPSVHITPPNVYPTMSLVSSATPSSTVTVSAATGLSSTSHSVIAGNMSGGGQITPTQTPNSTTTNTFGHTSSAVASPTQSADFFYPAAAAAVSSRGYHASPQLLVSSSPTSHTVPYRNALATVYDRASNRYNPYGYSSPTSASYSRRDSGSIPASPLSHQGGISPPSIIAGGGMGGGAHSAEASAAAAAAAAAVFSGTTVPDGDLSTTGGNPSSPFDYVKSD
ncbi:hypothetical protein H4R33_003349 [Dimargaris cristalligena]|nr:hypothetical protein H4R33_003349 [Dimargaris cristalligena]